MFQQAYRVEAAINVEKFFDQTGQIIRLLLIFKHLQTTTLFGNVGVVNYFLKLSKSKKIKVSAF